MTPRRKTPRDSVMRERLAFCGELLRRSRVDQLSIAGMIALVSATALGYDRIVFYGSHVILWAVVIETGRQGAWVRRWAKTARAMHWNLSPLRTMVLFLATLLMVSLALLVIGVFMSWAE